MIYSHHCAYFDTPILGSDYPKVYNSINSDFTFDLSITLSDTSAAYSGDVIVVKIGGGSFPNRNIDTITVSLLPGISFLLDNIVYPAQYLNEDILIFNEDSTVFPINVYFINSLCADEPIANSHVLLKMYKFHNATEVTASIKEKDFSLYPNPSYGYSILKNESSLNIDHIKIYNASSLLVREIKINNVSETDINVSGLEKGLYILEISAGVNRVKRKLIIE